MLYLTLRTRISVFPVAPLLHLGRTDLPLFGEEAQLARLGFYQRLADRGLVAASECVLDVDSSFLKEGVVKTEDILQYSKVKMKFALGYCTVNSNELIHEKI